MTRKKQDVNIYRIAEEAGVSIATISRVINRRAGVSEATRSRITELLNHYAFTPDYPIQRAPKLAILVPWDDISEYFRRAIKGICRSARENKLETSIIIKNDASEDNLLQQIRDQQCNGVIVALGDEFKFARRELAATELPCVFLDARPETDKLGYVDNDSYSGSLAAARHLISLGHRCIGYLRYGDNGVDNHRRRYLGYCDAMREAGLEIRSGWVIDSALEQTHGSQGLAGRNSMRRLLDQAPELTAVMAVDDLMAMGAMTTIYQAGLRIPDDISLTGFDNMAGTENWFPALTTVDHPLEQAGRLAADAIASAIKSPGGMILPHLTLPTKLIIRASTGPGPKQKIAT